MMQKVSVNKIDENRSTGRAAFFVSLLPFLTCGLIIILFQVNKFGLFKQGDFTQVENIQINELFIDHSTIDCRSAYCIYADYLYTHKGVDYRSTNVAPGKPIFWLTRGKRAAQDLVRKIRDRKIAFIDKNSPSEATLLTKKEYIESNPHDVFWAIFIIPYVFWIFPFTCVMVYQLTRNKKDLTLLFRKLSTVKKALVIIFDLYIYFLFFTHLSYLLYGIFVFEDFLHSRLFLSLGITFLLVNAFLILVFKRTIAMALFINPYKDIDSQVNVQDCDETTSKKV